MDEAKAGGSQQFRQVACTGPVPGPRSGAASVIVGDKLYLFGGYGGNGRLSGRRTRCRREAGVGRSKVCLMVPGLCMLGGLLDEMESGSPAYCTVHVRCLVVIEGVADVVGSVVGIEGWLGWCPLGI